MNGFQWIACAVLGAALVRDLVPRHVALAWKMRIIRVTIWSAALVAIVRPLWVTRFANLLGIGRGADIVLYLLALTFVAVAFYFYAQQLRLRRELSALAGHIATREARFGGTAPADRTSSTAQPLS